MAYVTKANLAEVRKAQGTLANIKAGNKVSNADVDHMNTYLDRHELSGNDQKRLAALDAHRTARATNPEHIHQDVNPYNGSEKWITVSGHHILLKAGTENYNRFFGETSNQGDHTATVKRRTDRPDGTAKAGDRRDINFKLDNIAHPPDPKRQAEDKKHNLITVPEYDDNGEMKRTKDGKPVFKRITLQDEKFKTLIDSRGRLKKFV